MAVSAIFASTSRLCIAIIIVLAGSACVHTSPAADSAAPPGLLQTKRLLDSRFRYVTDQEKWGQSLYWEQGHTGEVAFSGDCEEYADAAVYQLQKRGLSAEGWLVSTEEGELHMVACAQGWCIDNRQRSAFRQQTWPYRWLAGTGHY